MSYRVDRARINEPETGIFVRAQDDQGCWVSADLAHFTKASLLEWLTKDAGDNPLAENVVGILLGHGHLHDV